MGIPCVTTCITGIPELIRNGIDGLLVAPSDLDALVEALAKLMDDAALRQRLRSGREAHPSALRPGSECQELARHFVKRVKNRQPPNPAPCGNGE